MVKIIADFVDFFIELVNSSGPILGPIIGFLCIILESVIPILPLAAFIAMNMIAFGPVIGSILSFVATITGCMLSFWFFDKKVKGKMLNKMNKHPKTKKLIEYINKSSFQLLVLVIALPFSPAFAINIAGGISDIKTRKFFLALLIGKIPIIYFWGYIGTSLIESIKNPIILVKILIMLLISFIISKLVSKKLKIN